MVTWINLHTPSTSICRFVDNELRKLMPCDIAGTLWVTLVEFVAKDHFMFGHHADDVQIFQGDDAVSIHQLTGKFVRKIRSLVGNPHMNPGDNRLALHTLRCTLGDLLQAALRRTQHFLFTFEETRISDLVPSLSVPKVDISTSIPTAFGLSAGPYWAGLASL